MPRRRNPSIRSTPSTGELEWIGGRLALPGYVTEPAPIRPEMIVWLETPSGFVVGSKVYNPKGPHTSFADSFFEAARRPLAGRPRRPRRVRVETRDLADELEPVAREGIEVYIAPTPEIDELIERMMKQPAGEEDLHSYFEDGRVSKDAVAKMFDAARILHLIAPWKTMHDGQVLRLDIPTYGIEAACVSIIGNLGQNFGLLIFPGLAAFESFAERKQPPTRQEAESGNTLLSLEFDAVDDIPPRMCREIDENDWEVADPEAYPRVVHRDWDGVPRPLTERDVEIATACAKAVATFYVRNKSLLDPELDEIEPVSMTVEDENDLAVRFTYPYEAFDLFEPLEAPPARASRRPKIGRNDPCPCGSGKKYKKCHLGAEDRTWRPGAETSRQPALVHAMDERLVDRMILWAELCFGKVVSKAFRDVRDPSLVLPWTVYGFEIQGRPIVSHFLLDAKVDLVPQERRWLEAQEQAWLSVWEVQDVEPGRKLELLDLLTGERRHVHETSASRTLVQRDAILARVVSDGDSHVLCGVHSRPLPPRATSDVVKRVRARSRAGLSVERLRSHAAGRKLIQIWKETVERMDRERQKPPRLQNTDGEDYLLTVDRYRFDPTDHARITERLATVEGLGEPERAAKGVLYYTVVRPGNKQHKSWDNTVIAHLTLAKNKLEVETNSTPRADEIRRRVESACGKLLGNHKRQETDQEEMLARLREKPDEDTKALQPPPPEMAEVLSQEKQQFYQNWLDERIPALRGKTPRQAARLQRSRAELELLIKELENSEARLPDAERIDVGWIRDELGL